MVLKQDRIFGQMCALECDIRPVIRLEQLSLKDYLYSMQFKLGT